MLSGYVLVILCVVNVLGFNHIVEPGCSMDSDVCSFSVIVQHRYTMMNYSSEGLGVMLPVTVDSAGRILTRRKNCSGTDILPQEQLKDVVIGDGSHKLMILFNHSLPGPPIVVYEGQQVVVKVINNLENQATTVHFHGMHQRGTPWMDGAESVSQCSINPKESFTYRFIAQPAGTHWYHSHQGSQRTMGAYGPLIVLPRKKPEAPPPSLPIINEEFIFVIQDFMRKDSLDIFMITTSEAVSWAYGFESDYCFNSTKQADGFDCGVYPFDSGIINGRGRHYNPITGDVENPRIPLEVFTVQKGGVYRLRIISAAMTFAFRLSIDDHPLHVMATDGQDVEPKEVESLIIYSGERYDVWFEAKDPLLVGNYWIRATTLERTQNEQPKQPGRTEAILRYEGSQQDEPLTSRMKCSAGTPCKILNCPYRGLPKSDNSFCIPVSSMRSSPEQKTLGTEKDNHSSDEIEEHFLNFHFRGMKTEGIWRTTINGIANVLPPNPLQLHHGNLSDILVPCDEEKCLHDICRCSHVLHLPLGKTVQLNLAITVKNPAGVLNGNNHPIHIHGYNLQILKTGWPQYDPVTSRFLGMNEDISCTSDSCNDLKWKNESWQGGNVPGITEIGAPRKDTVVVPIGGYVVTRFKSDNPGFWFMHCHTEFHNLEGMSLVVKVGDTSDMTPPPANLKSCGSFHWSNGEFLAKLDKNSIMEDGDEPTGLLKTEENITAKDSFRYGLIGAGLGVIAVALTIGLVVAIKKKALNRSWGYSPIDPRA